MDKRKIKTSTPTNKKKRKKSKSQKQRQMIKKRKRQELIKQVGITIILTIFVLLAIAYFTFSLPQVEGYSMTPTVNNNDRLFVNKLSAVRRFNLIYFKDPKSHQVMIRRVIGLPNETLFYQQGKLYIDGEEVAEKFLMQTDDSEQDKSNKTPDFTLQETSGVQRIPQNKYFVLGDSRLYSTDSRSFGLVDEKEIIGTVTMRIFPLHEMVHF